MNQPQQNQFILDLTYKNKIITHEMNDFLFQKYIHSKLAIPWEHVCIKNKNFFEYYFG